MVARSPKSLWIVLEYLSAESWVAAHHGLPSPHPRLPLDRYFFFPGFGAGTGGLLREPALTARREDFLRRPLLPQAFWRDAGFSPPDPNAKLISLFGYETPAVAEFLEAWASGPEAIVAAVPESRLSAEVAAFFGIQRLAARHGLGALKCGSCRSSLKTATTSRRGPPTGTRARGGFVCRVQWPSGLVWHIYPQSAGAHLAKLTAFPFDLYCSGSLSACSRCERSARGGTVGRRRGPSARRGRISPAREQPCAGMRATGRGRPPRQVNWR
jgi:hypothetical protein